MPEGDALHRVARSLHVLVGERLEAESPNPRGLATGVARAVDGRMLEHVEAVGKYVLLQFDGGVVVHSHLRMRGRWRLRRRGAPQWRGAPWLVLRGSEWEATQWHGPVLGLGLGATGRLGPDLLAPETDLRDIVSRLRRVEQTRLVGEALVDQRLVAGIGNMWLAEALWQARVSPWSQLAEAATRSSSTSSSGHRLRCANRSVSAPDDAPSIAGQDEVARAAASGFSRVGSAA